MRRRTTGKGDCEHLHPNVRLLRGAGLLFWSVPRQCKTSRDCSAGQRCIRSNDANVCQLADEASCTYTSQCPIGLRCAVDSQCREPCIADTDCFEGQRCVQTTCADLVELDDAGAVPHDGAVESHDGAVESESVGRRTE